MTADDRDLRHPRLDHREGELERWSRGAEAAYLVAQATIRLGPWIDVFGKDGRVLPDADPHAVAVFVHEYIHFLHNCSTLVGVEQFVSTMLLVGLYGRTLDATHNGLSEGHAALDAPHRQMFDDVMVAYRHFVGPTPNDPAVWSTANGLRVLDWHTQPLAVPNLAEAWLDVEVLHGREVERTKLCMSVDVIEEGIAIAIERMFLNAHGLDPAPARFYPYAILSEVVRAHFAEASDADVCRAGLIALNATNPGVQLLELLRAPEATFPGDPAGLADRIGWHRTFSVASAVLTRRLDSIEAMFTGRGLPDHGLRSMFTRSRQLLQRRLREPFFELLLNDEGLDVDRIYDFIRSEVPCEVVVERHGSHDDVARDPILTFTGDPAETIEGRCAVHLQVHAMQTHLSRKEGAFVASDGRDRECPYFTSCSHATRRSVPDLCRTRPWEVVARKPDPPCWYASGILGLMAKVQVRARTIAADER